VLAAALLSLIGRSQAGPILGPGCCICNRCDGVFSCFPTNSSEVCPVFCETTQNSTSCGFDFAASSCAAVPQCARALGVPALGQRGMTAVALFLAGCGVVGLRRAARRKRV